MLARHVMVCLLVFTFHGVNAESNITLLHLPINLTSWKISLQNAFNQSLDRLVSLRMSSALNDTLDYLRNGSIGCTPQGEECVPGIPSCCPSTVSGHYGSAEDEDLQCLPHGDVYRCSLVTDPEDIAQLRLNALEYGDSAGQLESHPWVNSWEFQSRSEAEREELQALQDAEWKKNWKPSSQENVWVKAYNKVKNEAMNIWKDLRKMKKLKEVKDSLLDKKNKRLEATVPPVEQDNLEQDNLEQEVSVEQEQQNPVTQEAKALYPDELSEETGSDKGQTKTESEESVIKFSDELPKRDKKLNFRLDDIIKDTIDLASQKLKKTKQGSKSLDKHSSNIPSLASEEELLRLDEIQATVDKLMNEVNELKALKDQQNVDDKEASNTENKVAGPNIDDLIKKHVRNILEEKKRLYELRRLEEAKRLKQEGI